ncbi:histone-fold-containing protein [Meredithblackwellia eburnea MCA 4105]
MMEDLGPPQGLDYDEQQRIFTNIRPDPNSGFGATEQDVKTVPPAAITDQEVDTFKEQDRFLPIANVGRIMKKCLPTQTKVSKDAKECVQECTSEFISFITSEAAERCLMEKRKTINGEDILFAMTTLGFENYSDTLKIYLAKYREHQRNTGKRTSKKAKANAAGSSTGAEGGDQSMQAEEYEEEEDDDEEGDSMEDEYGN